MTIIAPVKPTRQRAHTARVTHRPFSPLSSKNKGGRAHLEIGTQTSASPPAFSAPEYQQLRALNAARDTVGQDMRIVQNRCAALERHHEMGMAATIAGLHNLETAEQWKTNIEKAMVTAAKDLPAFQWLVAQRGIDKLGAAVQLAVLGDPAKYRNPSALWKRAEVAVIHAIDSNGVPNVSAQRRFKDKALAAAHGYGGRRRAVAWNAAMRLCQYNTEYRALALERQNYRVQQGWARNNLCAKCRQDDTNHFCGHAGKDAKRYAWKRLLLNLWLACQNG